MVNEDLTALEALGIAIQNEITAQKLYQDLAARTENDLLKDRFLNLYQEEKRHQKMLEDKHRELFPDVELQIPPLGGVDSILVNATAGLSLKDVLNIAIREERGSREFYLDCAATVADLSGKRMFRFLADMEFSHQMILAAELEIIEKYPAYYEGAIKWQAETRSKTERPGKKK